MSFRQLYIYIYILCFYITIFILQVQELMEGETGKTAGKNVKEYSKMAKAALIQETGSSWKNLDLLFEKLCKSGETKEANN